MSQDTSERLCLHRIRQQDRSVLVAICKSPCSKAWRGLARHSLLLTAHEVGLSETPSIHSSSSSGKGADGRVAHRPPVGVKQLISLA